MRSWLRLPGRRGRHPAGADGHEADRGWICGQPDVRIGPVEHHADEEGGGPGYARALTVFVPKLKEAGASDEVLRQIMNDNPRRFLAFVPKTPRKA
ncbi:MAG: hypothetical protein QM736_04895 [Vicinamibacterales bacterium]